MFSGMFYVGIQRLSSGGPHHRQTGKAFYKCLYPVKKNEWDHSRNLGSRNSNISVLLTHFSHQAVPLIFCLFVTTALLVRPVAGTIGCFKCVSINGSNPSCEDPFHNNFSSTILESPCLGGRKGRDGLFPATACIKLAGTYKVNGTTSTLVVRGCALDSGTLTTDTEIVRMSHCGGFYFNEWYVKGCLQSCEDYDGCNQARKNGIYFPLTAFNVLIAGERWARNL